MHTFKANHEDNRKKVCGPCGNKIVVGTRKIDDFFISQK